MCLQVLEQYQWKSDVIIHSILIINVLHRQLMLETEILTMIL